jgi:integrase/recombinase XerC
LTKNNTDDKIQKNRKAENQKEGRAEMTSELKSRKAENEEIQAANVAVKVTNIDSLLNENLISRWLKFAGVGVNSVQTYSKCIKQLAKYFAEKNIATPTREDLEDWRDSLIDSGKSASTVILYLTATKIFFRFLAQENLYPNIADRLKNRVRISNNHKKDALSVSQAKDLQRAIKGNNLKALRDKAIISLMLATGIRAISVCKADSCDIRQIDGNYYLFIQGKGRYEKSESVLLAPKVYSLIQAYLKARKVNGEKVLRNSPLFVSTSNRNKDGRLKTQAVSRMIKTNLRAIGIDTPSITCHSLRHTFGTVLAKEGVELWKIQNAMHHKNLQTSLIYINSLNRLKNNAEFIAAKVLLII